MRLKIKYIVRRKNVLVVDKLFKKKNNDHMQTKFLLDSGDPLEFREIAELLKQKGLALWGATTNPTLIAKKLANKKVTQEEAFELQKKLVLEIVNIVPGAVSAEVYADKNTKSSEMIEQGKIIRTWHERLVVKLPTTIEGFEARTELRKEGIPINNTLVFSQEQIFAICLHEQLIQKDYEPVPSLYPPFISPFVGRLDDKGIDGMSLVENGIKIKKMFEGISNGTPWMLEASVRSVEHIKRGIKAGVELLTAPAKVYADHPKGVHTNLAPIEYWEPPKDLFVIKTIDEFMQTIESGKLNIEHELTDIGLEKFAADWKSIVAT